MAEKQVKVIQHPSDMGLEELQLNYMLAVIALAKVMHQNNVCTVSIEAGNEPDFPFNIAINFDDESGIATLCTVPIGTL